VWTATLPGGEVGFGWEWVELKRGVLVMKDPNTVLTNVLFLECFQFANALERIIHATRVIHFLPWQAPVNRALSKQKSPAPQAFGAIRTGYRRGERVGTRADVCGTMRAAA
jgi:hypothetical protein